MQNLFDLLEWPQVVAHLESCCQTGYGRLLVHPQHMLLPDAEAAGQEMARVEEAKTLILRYGDVSLEEPPDIQGTLTRLAKQGVIQSPQALGEFLKALRILRQLARFVAQNSSPDETPLLAETIAGVTMPNAVVALLEAHVSESGELLADVSDTYRRLKHAVQETQTRIQQQLQLMIAQPHVSKFLQEDIITQREGRAVLAVKAEHKSDVPGIVHGSSASGGTLYIEPNSIVAQNNKLKSLQSELFQEVQRIMARVSAELFLEAEALQQFVAAAGQLDLWLAKARQSLLFEANPVTVVSDPGVLSLLAARHPLLILQGASVVPNDVLLACPNQLMLITGPNTGGKTVLLKLVGLFALMCRAGLHLPVKGGSAMSWFDPVFVDMGDPQSITQSLSTFSGHIARLKSFLEYPDLSRSLILVDEICAGTDPQEGAALAQALLETFYERGATMLVTTHIGELKLAAHQHDGYVNACVEFDPETLSPTYRLIIGIPGTSHALNIAAGLGLPDGIIGLAKRKMTQGATETAALIESLEAKNRQLSAELAEAKRLKDEIQWEEAQIRTQLNRIEGEKKKTLQLYREGLKNKLRVIEAEVDELKDALKTARRGDPKAAQQLSGRFRKAQAQTGEMFQAEAQKLYPDSGLVWDQLRVGDTVESRSLSLVATVVEKHAGRQEVTLQAGILKTTVPFSDLVRPDSKAKAKSAAQSASHKSTRPAAPLKSWTVECDVRGMTQEDAIGVLEKFLDDAMLTGASTVAVIHGMGTGALKKAIRSYLRELPYIKAFGPAPAMEGGDGKTLITL